MTAHVLKAESRHLALRLRDHAGLLRLMNKCESSKEMVKLLEEAADEIERQSKIYVSAVKGRQQFREALREARAFLLNWQAATETLGRVDAALAKDDPGVGT